MIDHGSSTVDSSGPAVDLAFDGRSRRSKGRTMTLKKQLELYIEHRGTTAAKLAAKAGVSKQVLSLWLGGGSPRKIEQVKAVCDVLGVSVDHLCFGSGLEPKRSDTKDVFPDDEWMSGKFEIKVRRIK